MAIVMAMEWQGVTSAEYDRVMEILRLDETPPQGGVFHVAGSEGGNWRVVDVWESEQAWNAFFETRLKPALEQANLLDGRPQPTVRVYEVHNVYAPEPAAV